MIAQKLILSEKVRNRIGVDRRRDVLMKVIAYAALPERSSEHDRFDLAVNVTSKLKSTINTSQLLKSRVISLQYT